MPAEGTRNGHILPVRGAVSGGGERSQVDGSGVWWMVEGIIFMWVGGVAGREQRSYAEGSDRWWRAAVSGEGERSQVERNRLS